MRVKAKNKIDELFADGTAIDKALQQAFQEAVLRHRQAGVPMVFWKDGKITLVPPEDVPLPEQCNGAD
jgi:hypothetical protein